MSEGIPGDVPAGLDAIDATWPNKTHVITTTHIASVVIDILNGQPVGGSGLSMSQKYGIVNGLMILLSAWLLYATARTAKRCLRRWSPDRNGRARRSAKAIAGIVLHFAGPIIVLLLSTQLVPVWRFMTAFQPDIFAWLKIMMAVLALKGSLEIVRRVRI